MTDISELEGQALREAIALAKGWKLRDGKWQTLDGRAVDPMHMPQWDISLQAAFGLLNGLSYLIECFPDSDPPYAIEIGETGKFGAIENTLPLAICRSWLAMKQAQAAEVAP